MELIFRDTVASNLDLSKIIEKVKPYLSPQTLLLLEGDLGAGKTTFVTELLRSWKYDLAHSPTYALRQTYKLDPISIEHLDLYRLKDEEDIDSTGIWDVFSEPESLVLIEWGNKIPQDQWPLNWKKYQLKIIKTTDQRHYEFYSL